MELAPLCTRGRVKRTYPFTFCFTIIRVLVLWKFNMWSNLRKILENDVRLSAVNDEKIKFLTGIFERTFLRIQ